MIERLQSCLNRGGWRARLLLLCAGAIMPLALAPLFIWPVVFLSFPVLLMALHSAASLRQSFARGWWWGMGFCLAGFYWIVIALTVDLARFGWMIPFALLGLNGALAIFWGMMAALWFRLKRQSVAGNWLLFVLLYGTMEWLRGHILSGFPWNLAGYVWGASDVSAQAASLFGVYGLTWLVVLVASLPVLWVLRYPQARRITLVAAVFVLALLGWGYARLSAPAPADTGRVVRLVQAGVPQSLKWDPAYAQQSLTLHEALSQQPAVGKTPDIIIWPESAFPYVLDEASGWPAHVGRWLASGQVLVGGAMMRHDGKLYNSLIAIDDTGKVSARYDKHHLVPFGEYLPLRAILPDTIGKLAAGDTDFSAGTSYGRPIKLSQGIKALPLICYEIIFPALSFHAPVADVIVNITNDGWYGRSSGPYQHVQAARFRAIEQGVPVVRVAGTGISAVFDGYGRVRGQIALGAQAVQDVTLPAPLMQPTWQRRM